VFSFPPMGEGRNEASGVPLPPRWEGRIPGTGFPLPPRRGKVGKGVVRESLFATPTLSFHPSKGEGTPHQGPVLHKARGQRRLG